MNPSLQILTGHVKDLGGGFLVRRVLPTPQRRSVGPAFTHTPATAIPEIKLGSATLRVLVGEAFGQRSPVRTLAPTLYLDAPRVMWWNFVSSRKERIAQAADDWQGQRMGQVPGETEFIPLPEKRFTP